MPRTGTHYLEELLNAHPNVWSNGELLNPYDANWADPDRLERSDQDLLELAYREHPEAGKKTVTHVGCKINEPQFRERQTFFNALASWPDLKVILVVRRNTLESLRSLAQARLSGEWLRYGSDVEAAPPCVSLTVDDCSAYFKAAEDFHARIAEAFASSRTLTIEYERLRAEPSAHMTQVWAFLGVPAHPVPERTWLRQQETRPLSETVSNFHELKQHFAGDRYADFFGIDGDDCRDQPR